MLNLRDESGLSNFYAPVRARAPTARRGGAVVVAALSLLVFAASVASPQPLPPKADPTAPGGPGGDLLKPASEQPPRRGGDGRSRDPRQAIFHTNVPDHPLDVILARPEKNSITVSLLAYEDADIQVAYGTRPDDCSLKSQVVRLTKGEPNHLLIPNLTEDTHYFYQVLYGRPGGQLEPRLPREFHTARPKGQSFRFTVQADSHLDGATVPEVYAQTLANIAADRPDFHIDLGDTFMNDKYMTYRDAQRQYIAQRYYFGLACQSVPLFLVLGNHDGEAGWRQGRDNEGMAAWSNATRKRYFANPFPDAFYTGNRSSVDPTGRLEDYYAWEWGDALFVVLDPFAYTTDKPRSDADGWNWTLGREQYDWLRSTLEKSDARFKFVFLHHLVGGGGRDARGGVEAAPFFEWGGTSLDGKREFADKRPGWPAPIHQLLVKANVSAVFHGHDHLYARQALDGITYMEVPQPSHPAGHDVAKMASEYGYQAGKILGSPGHVRVTVGPGSGTIEFVHTGVASEDVSNRQVQDTFAIVPQKQQ